MNDPRTPEFATALTEAVTTAVATARKSHGLNGIVTLAEARVVASRCPCGKPYELVEYVTGNGICRNGMPTQNLKRFWAALYRDKEHNRDFCSADCATEWWRRFVWPFERHLGKRDAEYDRERAKVDAILDAKSAKSRSRAGSSF